MRTNVSFQYSVHSSGAGQQEEEVLTVADSLWFAEWLRAGLSGALVDPDICQEDWGVVVFLTRDGCRFWLGLSHWFGDAVEPEAGTSAWLVHFHHRGLWQRISRSGKDGMVALLRDFSALLTNTPGISEISWYEEKDMLRPSPVGAEEP